jgi:hypothetical protein
MNSLDRFMEYLAAGVFLWIGVRNIYSYTRRPKALGAGQTRLPMGLPYGAIVAVGLFEVVAALALVAPIGFWPQATLVRLAAVGLAGLMVASSIHHVRRQESAAPTVALFLLTLFVLVGRW